MKSVWKNHQIKDLYTEKCKTLIKEIEKNQKKKKKKKGKIFHVHGVEDFTVKMSILQKQSIDSM